jgi:hypothetical protein
MSISPILEPMNEHPYEFDFLQYDLTQPCETVFEDEKIIDTLRADMWIML